MYVDEEGDPLVDESGEPLADCTQGASRLASYLLEQRTHAAAQECEVVLKGRLEWAPPLSPATEATTV